MYLVCSGVVIRGFDKGSEPSSALKLNMPFQVAASLSGGTVVCWTLSLQAIFPIQNSQREIFAIGMEKCPYILCFMGRKTVELILN